MTRPRIVTLCGSTRFKSEFIRANFRETMAGRMVFSVGFFTHADRGYTTTEEEEVALDRLHLAKIDASDEILVINVGGYIGESTARMIAHAKKTGKLVRYLEHWPSKGQIGDSWRIVKEQNNAASETAKEESTAQGLQSGDD